MHSCRAKQIRISPVARVERSETRGGVCGIHPFRISLRSNPGSSCRPSGGPSQPLLQRALKSVAEGPHMRKAAIKRTTRETDVAVAIDLDGCGAGSISTGIGFLDHMLDLLAK